MRIQHNIAALNSYRQLGTNNTNVAKNLEKLSSGYKINRAGDDAAGLAISEKMRAQIKGLETAQKNANDGISLVQTAEGNLTEVHSMLNRMVELATQSANGTYDNNVDRENLQKEIVSLNSEIDRIASSANFNGIKLLDGSINEAKGVVADSLTQGAAVKSGSIGTLGGATAGDVVNGLLTPGQDEVKYSASFYVGDVTNSNGAAKTIVFNYKDNADAAKTVTLSIDAGKTVTTEDIVKALNGATSAGAKIGNITATDNGVAMTGATGAKGGTFKELFGSATFKGNIVAITAKNDNGTKIADSTIDGTKAKITSIANTLDAGDVTASVQALKEKYDGTNTGNIGYGTASGTATAYKAKVAGSYQVASIKLALGAGTATTLHNTAIKVGSKTYVFQKDNEEVKGTDGSEVIVKLDSATDTSATLIGTKLAAAISADKENNGGFVAVNNGGTLTITESTNRAADILANNTRATTGASIASKVELTLTDATTSGLLEIDADKLSNGTTVEVGNKKFLLTNDPTTAAPQGTTIVQYAKDATSQQISQALADAMAAENVTGVTAGANGVTFAGTEGIVKASGAGLTLQVGDTNESFQKVSVKISDMSTKALDIDDIDISTQDGAGEAIGKIKAAINTVSSTRGDLGALQNRLEHTINNLGVTTENMTAAESRIRDVDMAKEMMDFTKNNILVQASQAMLAQANQLPQGVLQLLQ